MSYTAVIYFVLPYRNVSEIFIVLLYYEVIATKNRINKAVMGYFNYDCT